MSPDEAILRQAIQFRLPVFGVYAGLDRFLCPHVLGYKQGRLQVLAYQFAGESASGTIIAPIDPANGPSSNWRCMEVQNFDELMLLPPGPWYTCPPRGIRSQTCIDQVIVRVC
jgi:hypothetical protein